MSDSRRGCLIIHGFAGGVHDVAQLADYLSDAGYDVMCTRLPGHTGVNRDLATAGYRDWIHAAERDLLDLRARCDRVSVIGFSMGGLVASILAVRHEAEALVLLNTPIAFGNPARAAANIIEDLRTGDLGNIRRYCRRAVVHPPLVALLNFLAILRTGKRFLTRVTCPVFIGQALKDDVVQPWSAKVILARIASKRKKIKRYADSGHLIFHGPEKDDVLSDVRAFIDGETEMTGL